MIRLSAMETRNIPIMIFLRHIHTEFVINNTETIEIAHILLEEDLLKIIQTIVDNAAIDRNCGPTI